MAILAHGDYAVFVDDVCVTILRCMPNNLSVIDILYPGSVAIEADLYGLCEGGRLEGRDFRVLQNDGTYKYYRNVETWDEETQSVIYVETELLYLGE